MKYRNVHKVIEAIKKATSKDWNGRESFIASLDDVIDSSNYRAPEAYSVNYEQLAMQLGRHLGEPDTDWKRKIGAIFADKIKIKGMDYYEYPPKKDSK